MLRVKRLFKRLFLLVLIFYIGGVWIYGCADSLVLWPSRYAIDAGPAKELLIPHDGQTLQAWVMRTPAAEGREPDAYMLLFHGNGSRAERVAQYSQLKWGDRAVETWTINYPGYGGSTGPARLRSIAPTALAAYDEIKKRAGNKPIYVEGVSLGSTAALYLAAHRPVTGIICQNPPALRSLIMGEFGWWNLWLLAAPVSLQIPADLDSVANGAHCTSPAIFLLAANDTFVLPKYQRKVADAYAGPKKYIVLQGADHNSGFTDGQFEELRAAIDAWSPMPAVHAAKQP